MKLIDKIEFIIIALNLNDKKFVMHILVLEAKTLIDLLSKIIILIEYLNYTDIFLPKFKAKLLEYNNNNYIIKLKKGK